MCFFFGHLGKNEQVANNGCDLAALMLKEDNVSVEVQRRMIRLRYKIAM